MANTVTSSLGRAIMSRAGNFFRYTDGHWDFADRPQNATFFNDPNEIVRAMQYAMKDGHTELYVVEVYCQARIVEFSYEDTVRKAALAKLNEEDKRVLGL